VTSQPTAIERFRSSESATTRLKKLLTHALLIAGAIIIFIPIAWMISTSLKPPQQVRKFPPIWIPNPIVWSNYITAVTIYPVSFLIFIRNSLVISGGVVLGTVLSNTVVAFAFARLRFPEGSEEAWASVGPYVLNGDFELSSFGLPVPLAVAIDSTPNSCLILRKFSAIVSSASSQLILCHLFFPLAPTLLRGNLRRSGWYKSSGAALPLAQVYPFEVGLSGSPVTLTTFPFLIWTKTPHIPWHPRQVDLTILSPSCPMMPGLPFCFVSFLSPGKPDKQAGSYKSHTGGEVEHRLNSG